MALLSIRNLHASIGEREILKGVNLEINAGEVHSIMGPNGNGKSTLAGVIAGNSKYTVTEGEVIYKGKNILDETDSGLDIDALRIVASGVNKLRRPDNATIVITHYQRLLDYIVPDFVHVLYEGRIVKTGPKELALELEQKGYEWIKEELESGK